MFRINQKLCLIGRGSSPTVINNQNQSKTGPSECGNAEAGPDWTRHVVATGVVPFTGDIPDEPWQSQPYNKKNAMWQAAGQRRHMHRRHLNQSLGVCVL